jgi:hypothetical protein
MPHVFIELCDMFDEIGDDELVQEVQRRGLSIEDEDGEPSFSKEDFTIFMNDIHECMKLGNTVRMNSILEKGIWDFLGKIV